MAVHTLVTGTPGAGKTLYTLWELARPLVGAVVPGSDGRPDIPRRLVVGNVRNLLLPHELMEVTPVDPESWKEPDPDLDRSPGDPPLDVVCRVDNWFLWCQPGDVIIVDECQRAFRPFASGRRVPRYIARLETARHYGVEFIFVTQHPQLLHTNVRNLVGRHLHVRRVLAGAQTLVYEWDHCTHPDRVKNATTRAWRHKKAAFEIYSSAEVHTKGKASIPFALFVLVAMVFVLPAALWYAKTRISRAVSPPPAAAAASAPMADGQAGHIDRAAVFVAPDAGPAFADAVVPRYHWPASISGCWTQAGECLCMSAGEYPPRIIRDRPAVCVAIVMGDLVAPPGRNRRTDRIEPTPAAPGAPAGAASGPDGRLGSGLV